MSDIYDADFDGDGDLDKIEYEQHSDGSASALIDLNGDGQPDVALYDANGDGQPDYVAYDGDGDGSADYAGPLSGVIGHESGHESAPEPGYADSGYTQHGYTEPGYTEPGYTDGGNFYANDNLGTAVSSNSDGSAGYVNTGDGEFYSWG